MNSQQLVDEVMSAVLPGRYPTPKGSSEDYAVTKLLKHRRTLTEAAEAFLLIDEDGHNNARDQLLALLMFLDPNAKQAWNARAIKTHESLDWKQRWQGAVEALRRAAELLDDPVTGSDLRPKRRLHPNQDPAVADGLPDDMGAVDAIVRYVEADFLALAVRRIANAIEEAGWENIVPNGARYRADQWHGVSPKLIGRRGGAADDEAASRALLVKELAKRLPPNARHRNALIARLAAIPGVDVSRQYVASLLKGGRT